MNVEAILDRKGRDIVTVHEMKTVEEAARLLDSHGIGAAVIVDDYGGPVAVLSERDITREIALNGSAALGRPVAHVMTPAFVTAAMEDSLADLMVRMTDRRVRHLPVVVSGRLAGIISIGDVVKAKIETVEAESAAMLDYILS